MVKRGKKPVKRTNEMDLSMPSCFLKLVFVDQTIRHLMVIVSIVSQSSVSNKHPWRIACPVILPWWEDDEKKPLESCKFLFHKTVRWAAQLEGDKRGIWLRELIHPWGLWLHKSPKQKRTHPHELYFHIIEVISSCQQFTTGSKIWKINWDLLESWWRRGEHSSLNSGDALEDTVTVTLSP